MSSPPDSYRRSPSSQCSTPSRSLQNGGKRANGYHRGFRKSVTCSPASPILEELGRMLIHDERTFRTSLDEQSAAQHRLHVAALDRALAKHEEVRGSAERVRERVELELEKERRRLQEEERRAVERAKRELEQQRLEEQKRLLEEQRAVEESRRRVEELKRREEEAKRQAGAQKAREEEQRRKKEQDERAEADRKAKEEAEKSLQAAEERQKAAQQSSSAPPTDGLPQPSNPTTSAAASSSTPNVPQGLVSSQAERDAVHRKYLDIHKKLKEMRAYVREGMKQTPALKQLSDRRRRIKTCLGQLKKTSTQESKQANKQAKDKIIAELDAAAQIPTPSIDVTQFLLQSNQPAGANTQGPVCLVYLLNCFAKFIIAQLISEAAVDQKQADPIGVLAVSVFARPQYLFNGQSFIDILWAKYHKSCPALFGVSGSEKTKEGRLRLGWPVEDGVFLPEQAHYDRMTGLGVGFAAITLRDFSRTQIKNPAPNRIFWEALARIVNTPVTEVQPTHFILLKAMIANYVPRILATFGQAALAALRSALVQFPNEKGPADAQGRKVPAVAAVLAMPAVLQRELSLTL